MGVGKGNNPAGHVGLKPFKKGQSGNPKGKPKGSLDYKARFKKLFMEEVQVRYPDGRVEKGDILESIIMSTMNKAHKGDIKAAQFVFERGFGKEKDQVELTGKDGSPLQIDHTGGLREAQQRFADAFNNRSVPNDTPSSTDRSLLSDDSGSES